VDFNLSEEEAMLRDSVARFSAAEYALTKRAQMIAEGRDNWHRFAELGWLGVGIAEIAGGYGGSLSAMATVAERLSAELAIEPYVGGVVFPSQVLIAHLGDKEAARFLEPMIAGETRLAVGGTELGTRAGLRWTETRAEDSTSGFVLNGAKMALAGGASATDFLISARTSGGPYDPGGISLFHIPRGTPGFKVRPWRMIDGSELADVELEDVRLGADALLGKPGAALGSLAAGLDTAIAISNFEVVGAMESALAATVEYIRTRKQFGGPLSDFQVLRHRCADMLVDLEQARSAAIRGLAGASQPNGALRAYATSSAKAVVIRASEFVCGQAIQLHGGMGVTDEMRVGHLFKRAAAANALYGSRDFHLGRMESML
jgi:alkylation response protein AidB-like acyl-CoA dehydrogenase